MACLVVCARSADSVTPESCTVTNLRSEAQGKVGAGDYYRGTTLLLTNCLMYSGTSTNSGRQGLSGVTIEVRVGDTDTNVAYTANVANTNGEWSCSIAVPNLQSAWLQVKITDGSGNVYIYPWKTLTTLDPLD